MTAPVVLLRSRFVGGSVFPDRQLYPVDGGYLSVADDGSVSTSPNNGPSESFYLAGDIAWVDKGSGVPAYGFKVIG